MKSLPIDGVLPQLLNALRERRNAVLVAQPGAGKTTRVPLALLKETWLAGQRIIMLEPRRLAARSAARYMAAELGEQPGGTVGYRVRMDTKVGPSTRIEVVTEGVLTRMLQEDPALEGVGAVLFDEYHERHLHSDLGLALCLQTQSLLRDDLRLLIMSATIEAEPVAELLGDAPVIESTGRQYPVETRYRPLGPGKRLEEGAAAAALEAVREGDVLVFLPGMAEMRRTDTELRRLGLPDGVKVAFLHGSLPLQAQDEAIAPCGPGERKIVLSTSIAESSLTVEGITAVVDSGRMRVPRFSPRTGMTRLETVAVSRASADQRRGRAGRLGPGICFRLWSQQQQLQLPASGTPELLEADLAPLTLELAVWGVHDPLELAWLDPPPQGAYAQARELLRSLGALDESGRVTPHGRRMAALGGHPRLAHMALASAPLGWGDAACELAALLGERDLLRGERSADIRLRLEALRAWTRGGAASGRTSEPGFAAAAAKTAAEARQWRRALAQQLGASGSAAVGGPATDASPASPASDAPDASIAPDVSAGFAAPVAHAASAASVAPAASRASASPGASAASAADAAAGADGSGASMARAASAEPPWGLLLALAYPDRIAQRRPDGRFLLANGRGAALAHLQPLSQAAYLAAAELDDSGTESRIDLAAPVSIEELEEAMETRFQTEETVEWDREAGAVRGRRRVKLGALVIREVPLHRMNPDEVADALLDGIRQEGIGLLPWSRGARQLQERIIAMHSVNGTYPDVSDEALSANVGQWLAPFVHGMKSREDLRRLPLTDALESMLDWPQRRELDEQMPTHITVPSGSRVPVDYSDPAAPAVAVRLQEMFGMRQTPRLGGGRLPLTLHLLSPARRPVQVTRDLESFWSSVYFEVKKDLKGRYPKHYWPDDPLSAIPTSRAKPRT
ncbi:ATP-dependent helicase HrpB [Paenibacillus beijingensis]|uniref:ATP-dependent helicase n=1 Tax=Paenibacillus beijingensis TaxID=1126833 RepID=A0A0D5NRG2_9BACL|nr:ATP-dependent helicase HrpB [Paenibacillus beijingensis]AJY77919.1 ATP-dependent helicase [Paenibacillus beijingensis]